MNKYEKGTYQIVFNTAFFHFSKLLKSVTLKGEISDQFYFRDSTDPKITKYI